MACCGFFLGRRSFLVDLKDFIQDRLRILKAKREQEYFEIVNHIAKNNIEPTHGAYGGNMGMGVKGYTLKGKPMVVFVRDEDIQKAKDEIFSCDENL